MTRCDHYNCRLHIRVVYFSIVLMFVMLLFNLFVSVYSPHGSHKRTGSPDTEIPYSEYGKPNRDKHATVNRETFGGRVAKREVSSENEMNCGKNCQSQSGNEEDSIQLTGIWRIKKSDLWDYCFRAEDFCRRNGSGIKRNDSEEEGKEEIEEVPKDYCFINKVNDRVSMSIPPIYEMSERWLLDPLQDPPGGEFSIWVKRFGSLLEYRVGRNLTYVGIRNNYTLPDEDLSIYSGALYNGSYFYQYKREKKIVKLNLTTSQVIKEKELEDGFGFDKQLSVFGFEIFFHSDEYGLWVVYFLNSQIVWLHINPETLNILSIRNSSSIRYATTRAFAALGKLYYTEIRRFEEVATVYSLLDFYHRNESDVSLKFNVTGAMNKVLYDWLNQYLYVDEYGGYFRYTVHFECFINFDPDLESSFKDKKIIFFNTVS